MKWGEKRSREGFESIDFPLPSLTVKSAVTLLFHILMSLHLPTSYTALVMNWGEKRSREEFESIDFPAIIYNQVLSRSQASLSTYDEPAHHAAIADIVPHECPKTPTPSTMGKGQGRQSHLRTSPDGKQVHVFNSKKAFGLSPFPIPLAIPRFSID